MIYKLSVIKLKELPCDWSKVSHDPVKSGSR